MDNIGLRIQDIKIGLQVYYYDWIDKPNRCHSEPIKTTITHEAYQSSSGDIVCFVSDVSGYVLTSHLSTDYYKSNIVKLGKSVKRYDEYLHADFYDSFSQFLGIQKPVYENHYLTGWVRLVSQKYPSVKSDYFQYKKDAKDDYKIKLKEYKQKHKIR